MPRSEWPRGGQHCPEGWTLYPPPGPQMKNVSDSGSADYHYYNWVDQFDTLGWGLTCQLPQGLDQSPRWSMPDSMAVVTAQKVVTSQSSKGGLRGGQVQNR